MRRRVPEVRRVWPVAVLALVGGLLVVSAGSANAGGDGGDASGPSRALRAAGSDPGTPGPLGEAQRRAIAGGYNVPDRAAHERAKAEADRQAGLAPEAGADEPGPLAPTAGRSWQGLSGIDRAPSDSTGAIGTTRYIELVNSTYAIYNRTSNAPLGTGSLNSLVGEFSSTNVFDPQIMWDPGTSRFYYVTDGIVSSFDNRLEFGFSKTASPNSAADFCKYFLGYGDEFPDYPKLGDTQSLILIGVNTFDGVSSAFIRTDLVSISKPPAGSTCPSPASFGVDDQLNLRAANGDVAWTPVPAQQTDNNGTGHVVATRCCSGTYLSIFRVTGSGANMTVSAPFRINVAAYADPANAPQPGTSRRLDTLDTRVTQHVSAIDPSRGNAVGLWFQHTIFGGAGAKVRWYEINAGNNTPFQTQEQSSNSLFHYNAAIAPDRRRQGASGTFGSAMVLNYNTSSSSQRIDIRAVSKVGNGAVSGPLIVRTSAGVISDFSCNAANVCRWGDYSAATPDPASPTNAGLGRVWNTNAFAGSASDQNPDWLTQNFEILPQPASK